MSRAVFDAVVALAVHDDAGPYRALVAGADAAERRAEVAATAQFHLVGGFVGAVLQREVPDDPLAAHFARVQQQATLHHLRTMADLRWAAGVFDAAEVSWAVCKGPFLVEHAYRRVDVRKYTDLDVLIDRHRFGVALDALDAGGARLSDRNWPVIAASGRGELSVVLPHGTLLDLHWHLIVDRPVRRGFRIDVDDVLARRRLVGEAPDAMWALASDDAWFHTAMHAVLSGADRLLWALDLHRLLVVDGGLDAVAWRRAQRFGWAAPGAIAADMVRSVCSDGDALLGPVPQHLWRRVHAWLTSATGMNRSLDGAFSAKTFTTSVRRSTPASFLAFASIGWDQAVRGPLVNPDHPWRRRRKGLPPVERPAAPLKLDVPSRPDRRAFLDQIAHSG